MIGLTGPASFALLASLAWGVADFSGGFVTRQAHVLRVLAWAQPAGLLLILAALAASGEAATLGPQWPWAVAAGLASLASLGMLFLALATGSMLLVAPLAAVGVVVPVAVGLVSGDAVGTWQLAGLCFAVGGTLATTWGPAQPSDRVVPRAASVRAALLALGSATGQGLFLTFLDRAGAAGPMAATATMRTASCLVVLVVYAVAVARSRRTARRQSRVAPSPVAVTLDPITPSSVLYGAAPLRLYLLMAVVGVMDALAEVLFALSSAHGQLSDAAVLSSLYPAVTMVLAVTLLRERTRPVQALGAVVVLTGVVLLSTP